MKASHTQIHGKQSPSYCFLHAFTHCWWLCHTFNPTHKNHVGFISYYLTIIRVDKKVFTVSFNRAAFKNRICLTLNIKRLVIVNTLYKVTNRFRIFHLYTSGGFASSLSLTSNKFTLKVYKIIIQLFHRFIFVICTHNLCLFHATDK